jgi:hypothetical protein
MKQISIASLLLVLIALSFYSCRKEKDTTATITVVNAAGENVAGVTVRVYCPDATCNRGVKNDDMDRTDVTGNNGKVKFDYTEQYQLGQAGFAVLDIEVRQTASSLSADATGVVKIEEEQQNEQTIICQTCP